MAVLTREIEAFDQMRTELEANHFGQWAVFHAGEFVAAFPTSTARPAKPWTDSTAGRT